MKSVLLVDPIYNPGTIPPNIPLSRIAAGLSLCDIKVDVVDFLRPDCENNNLEYFRTAENDLLEKIATKVEDCELVYITTGTGGELKPYPVFPRIVEIAKKVKSKKAIRVVIGGAAVNLLLKVYALSEKDLCGDYIDKAIVGDEYNHVMSYIMGSDHYPESVVPMWDIWDKSNYPEYQSVQYKVGCLYSCDFCFEGKIFDRASNTTRLNDFIESITAGRKIVVEDSVLMSYEDYYELMDRFEDKRIQFAAYGRISEIIKDRKKVERLKRAGCMSLIVGVETLDSNLLQKYNKNIVSEQTREGLDILKDVGIDVQGCFMLGFPGDTMQNMERTIQFAIDEQMNGYRWHIYQPNYRNMPENFYCSKEPISLTELLKVQLNVPDNCLAEILKQQPVYGKIDEHFMIRAKSYVEPSEFKGIGYYDSFDYCDIKNTVDRMFPTDWVLNEEKLYSDLFISKYEKNK